MAITVWTHDVFYQKGKYFMLNIFSSFVHLKFLGKIMYLVSVIVSISQIEMPFPTKMKHVILEKWLILSWNRKWTKWSTKLYFKLSACVCVRVCVCVCACVRAFAFLNNINHSRILYDPPPRILEIKAKINKWDVIKLKAFAQWRKL